MARFPAAFLSYTAASDFYDNTGRHPPVTRITIELPEELVDYSSSPVGENAPYTPQPVDPGILSNIQTLVMRQYSGVARQFLGAFRQGRELSGLDVITRSSALDAGVGMRYTSQLGMESIRIHVSPEAVRKLLGKKGATYLLVLYNTSDIAVVSIETGGTFKLVKKKTLAKSKWEKPVWWDDYVSPNPYGGVSYYLPTAQMKISDKLHAMTCSIKIDGGVITVPDDNLEIRPFYNVTDTIHKYALNSLLSPWLFPNYYVVSNDPVINGQNDYVYNEYLDKFQVTSTGLTRVKDGVALPTRDVYPDTSYAVTYPRDAASPSAISVMGNRYSHVGYFADYYTVSYVNIGALPFTQAQWDAAANYFQSQTSGVTVYAAKYGPGNSDFEIAPGFASIDNVESGSGNLTTKLQIYGKNTALKLDVFSLVDISFSFNYTKTKFPVASATESVNYNGISATTTLGDEHDIDVFSFPYATGSSSDKMFYAISSNNGSNFVTNFHTPYEDWQVLGLELKTSQPVRYLFGWLNISNGQHLVQGYLKQGRKRLYLDGQEKGTALAAAIGCDLDNILTMFMDVKLSDVDKLK